MLENGLSSVTGCVILDKLLPCSDSPLSRWGQTWSSLAVCGQESQNQDSRILSYVFSLLLSTQAPLWERKHPFSTPQQPCPFKKEIQAYV